MRNFKHRRWLIAAAFVGAAALAGGSYAVSAALRYAAEPTPIAVRATPITAFDNRDPSRVRFGALEFRGGLAMTSSFQPFGGISAIHMEPDGGHFVAVTDRGSWLRGRLTYKDGKPDGIADSEMAPILVPDGKALAARGWFDVESLTERDGFFYVGIERVHKIVRFDFAKQGIKQGIEHGIKDGVLARGEPIAVPADFKTLKSNNSLECLAAGPKGSSLDGKLIAVTERSLDANGNHRAYVIEGGVAGAAPAEPVARFSVKRSDDFNISDCTILPPGDLLLLERRYSPVRGVAMRIRRVPLAAIKEGALVDGTELIEADLAYQIDNMEGIAVSRNAAGETVLTLTSDDNFSVIQRNLLLQFVLSGE
jgi:hypothetical protein